MVHRSTNMIESEQWRTIMFKIINTPEYHIDKASELMDKGDYQKAAKILKPYAEKGYVIAMLYYANCLMQTDLYHFDEAIG